MRLWNDQLREDGYAVVRGVFGPDEMKELRRVAERVRQQSIGRSFTERFGNVRFFSDGDGARVDQLRSVIWCGLLSRKLEAVRRDPRLFQILQPLLGDTIRQVTNQLHFKSPGSDASFPLHADRSSRLRDQGDEIRHLESCFFQTGVALDAMSEVNGGLYFVPGSHRWSANSSYAHPARSGRRPEEDYEDQMPPDCVPIHANAGDVVVWSGDTIHGSSLNASTSLSRTVYINGYVRATDCIRGYWAWIRGSAVPLPAIDVPVLVYGDATFAPFDRVAATRLVDAIESSTGL